MGCTLSGIFLFWIEGVVDLGEIKKIKFADLKKVCTFAVPNGTGGSTEPGSGRKARCLTAEKKDWNRLLSGSL